MLSEKLVLGVRLNYHFFHILFIERQPMWLGKIEYHLIPQPPYIVAPIAQR